MTREDLQTLKLRYEHAKSVVRQARPSIQWPSYIRTVKKEAQQAKKAYESAKRGLKRKANPASIRAQVRRLPSGQIQLKIPIGRSENPHSVIAHLKKMFGKRVKAVEMTGGKKRNPTEYLPEKEIGDFTVAVVDGGHLNGPYKVVVFGGPSPRTLAARFETVSQAAEYLKRVSSKTLMQKRMF